MKYEGRHVLYAHVSYRPVLGSIGEMKTKPTQHSVKALQGLGIQPDFIICRSEQEVDAPRREKVARFCSVNIEDIIANPDVNNIYEVPLKLDEQKIGDKILKKLALKTKKSDLSDWIKFVERMNNATKEVKIGIGGKYFDVGKYKLRDSYISVIEAIKHAAGANEVQPKMMWIDAKNFEENENKLKILDEVDGIIVPGGFGSGGVEGKILAIKYARINEIPFLGLYFGFQLAVVEYARNVCGLGDANTTEVDRETKISVVDFLPWQKELIKQSKYGATMRLGAQVIRIKKNTLVWRLYNNDCVIERFRHRYEIKPKYSNEFETYGFIFSGETEKDEKIMQIGELPEHKHKFFIGTQAHPEFTSRPLKPNPLFNGFIRASIR